MHLHGSPYFARRPPPTHLSVKMSKFNFFTEHDHVAYQINWNHEKKKHSTFSEHRHVAYQIYWNHKMQQLGRTILPADSIPPPLKANFCCRPPSLTPDPGDGGQ